MRGNWAFAFWLIAAIGCASEPQPVTAPQLMPDPSPYQYPVDLWDKRVQGETLVLVHVLRDGTVDSVSVDNSSGHPQLDSAALAGSMKLRFVPGKLGETPVDMWTKLPVRFSLDSAGVR